ncbi:MAG TPA: hypothetical protein VF618_09175 [Thermoanaerobaculia bacterium]
MKSVALGLLLIAAFAASPSDGKRPVQAAPGSPDDVGRKTWEWTLEERLAERTSAAAAAERVTRYLRSTQQNSTRRAPNAPAEVIDGNLEPQLFVPTELFQSVIRRGFVGETWRDVHVQDLAAVGLPRDFWERLERLAGPFVEDLRRQEALLTQAKDLGAAGREEINRQIAAEYPLVCRHRAEALAAARAEFGPLLDRFMYEHIARGQIIFATELTDGTRLSNEERGCR